MLGAGREITRYRVWVARLLGVVLLLFAIGIQASASPTRFMDVAGAPIVSLILVLALVGAYRLVLLLLSRPASGGE